MWVIITIPGCMIHYGETFEKHKQFFQISFFYCYTGFDPIKILIVFKETALVSRKF